MPFQTKTSLGNLLTCDRSDCSISVVGCRGRRVSLWLLFEEVSRETIVDECIVAFEGEPVPSGINEQRKCLELIEGGSPAEQAGPPRRDVGGIAGP